MAKSPAMKFRSLLVALVTASFASMSCGPKPTTTTTTVTGKDAPNHVDPPASSNEPAIPLFPQIRHGVLPNGLTYYVLPHGKPEKRANLWLAVDAGAVNEDDDQRGLAHFCEHMLFNGTKHFPHGDIVSYIESVGIKFGADLNAYTQFDETVYQLQVPTDDAKLVTKGFDILRDWAGEATFDPAEVEKERGVVMEEWRLGRGFQQRLLDKLFEVVFGESKYAKRNPIGLPEIIQKAPRDRLFKFYKDWYRPDLMAVIAVGDFADGAAIEKEIIAKFGDLPKPTTPRAKVPPGVPAASGTRVAIETDKELPISAVAVGQMVAHRSQATMTDFRRALGEQLYQLMLNERLQSIGRRPEAPFATAAVIIQNVTRQVDAFARFALVKNDDSEGALRALFTEVLRVEKHGFVQSELDRARTVMSRGYEESAATAATRDSKDLVAEIVRNFLSHEFIVGPDKETAMALAVLPQITLTELNAVAKSFGGAENRVIAVLGPDGKPMPSKARVLAIVDEVAKSTIEPWKDVPAVTKLMEEPAWPGTIAKESKIDALGVTEWTLANGARVIIKPTDYEKDSISITAFSPGGLATAAAKDFANARFATEVASVGGVGELDADALGKALAGKHVSVSAEIHEVSEEITGTASVRDLETMFQLVNLKMSAPRRDEAAFGVWKTNLSQVLANQSRSPDSEFSKRSTGLMWQNNPRRMPPESADVKAVDLDKALGFYRERFHNASDFTFVIVGAANLAQLKPLVEAYIGSLPGTNKKEKEIDVGFRRVPGVVKQAWKLGQDQDKAQVQLVFHGEEQWSRDKDRDMSILGDVLEIRLFEVLREEMSGVYGVGAGGSISRSPRQERVFQIRFGCAPGAVDKLVDAAYAEIAKIAKGGIEATYIQKVKQTFIRERETAMKTNVFWLDWLARSARHGDDPTIILDQNPVIARMTSDNIKAAAIRFLDRKRVFQAVLMPK